MRRFRGASAQHTNIYEKAVTAHSQLIEFIEEMKDRSHAASSVSLVENCESGWQGHDTISVLWSFRRQLRAHVQEG